MSPKDKKEVFPRSLKKIAQLNYNEWIKVKSPRNVSKYKKKGTIGERLNYMESEIGSGKCVQAKSINPCNVQGSFTRAVVSSLYFVSVDFKDCERHLLGSCTMLDIENVTLN